LLPGFAACYPLYAGSATAVALLCGWLIDQGIGLDRQALLPSLLVCASALGFALLLPSLLRDHAPPAPRLT